MTKKLVIPKGYDATRLASIVILRACGNKQDDIAQRLGVSQSQVSRYCVVAVKLAKGREVELVKWAIAVEEAMQQVVA